MYEIIWKEILNCIFDWLKANKKNTETENSLVLKTACWKLTLEKLDKDYGKGTVMMMNEKLPPQ